MKTYPAPFLKRCLLIFALVCPLGLKADPTVLTVDGEPVSASEYKLVMEGRTAEVTNYFYAKDGLADQAGYWKDDGKPANPIRTLRDLVIAELRGVKTVQRLAKAKGVTADISYAAFHADFLRENARRAKALENKEVIYGPKLYKERPYYYFRQTDLGQVLLAAFSKEPENAIPEAEITAFYAENYELFAGKPLEDVRGRIVSVLQKKKYEQWIKDRTAQAKVEINADVLGGIAPRHDL